MFVCSSAFGQFDTLWVSGKKHNLYPYYLVSKQWTPVTSQNNFIVLATTLDWLLGGGHPYIAALQSQITALKSEVAKLRADSSSIKIRNFRWVTKDEVEYVMSQSYIDQIASRVKTSGVLAQTQYQKPASKNDLNFTRTEIIALKKLLKSKTK